MGTATRPDCTDLHVVTAPPEKVLDLQSRDPRSCTSSVSGNKRCPITPPPTLPRRQRYFFIVLRRRSIGLVQLHSTVPDLPPRPDQML